MHSKIDLTPDTTTGLSDRVYAMVLNGTDNIDLSFTELENMDENFFKAYEVELSKLSNMIIDLHGLKKLEISINVLTDPIMGVDTEVEDQYIICKKCPCLQCIQDPDLFRHTTGFPNIPPEFYCKKSFLELSFSREIASTLFGIQSENFNHKDWRECIILKELTMNVTSD